MYIKADMNKWSTDILCCVFLLLTGCHAVGNQHPVPPGNRLQCVHHAQHLHADRLPGQQRGPGGADRPPVHVPHPRGPAQRPQQLGHRHPHR